MVDSGLSKDESSKIKRDSTLDLNGFTSYLERQKTNEENFDSRRGTELLIKEKSSNPISLNIEAIIKSKNGQN